MPVHKKIWGPAGTTLVIIKDSLLGKVTRAIPSMLSYQVHLDKESMFNTPPVFAVYTSMLNMRWIDAQGGIEALGEQNAMKATLLYGEIDRNPLFEGFANKEDRSDMNATFNLKDSGLTSAFDSLCETAGISGLKGHRSVGGFRASMYNALSIDSVEILVNCMQILEEKN